MSVLVEVDWPALTLLVKRTAKVCIANGRRDDAILILRELEEVRQTQPLVTLLSCKCDVLIKSICREQREKA